MRWRRSAGPEPAEPLLPPREWAVPPAQPSVARLICAAPFMAAAVICLAAVEGLLGSAEEHFRECLLGSAEEHFRECLAAEDHGGSYDVEP